MRLIEYSQIERIKYFWHFEKQERRSMLVVSGTEIYFSMNCNILLRSKFYILKSMCILSFCALASMSVLVNQMAFLFSMTARGRDHAHSSAIFTFPAPAVSGSIVHNSYLEFSGLECVIFEFYTPTLVPVSNFRKIEISIVLRQWVPGKASVL